MFTDIGKKIKFVSMALCWIGIIASVIIAFTLFGYEKTALLGALVLFGGSFVSWVCSFFVYGFGELIDKVSSIEAKISYNSDGCSTNLNKLFGGSTETSPNAEKAVVSPVEKATNFEKRNAELNKLLDEGLISEEEYNNALNK